MEVEYDFVEESYEDLIKQRGIMLNELKNSFESPSPALSDPEVTTDAKEAEFETDLYQFYREFYLKKYSEPAYSPTEWKWLEGVRSVADDIQACVASVSSDIDEVEKENQTMISELSGLDGKSKKLLGEQAVIEKVVNDLEAKMITVNAIRDATSVINNRDLIVTDFPLFERSVRQLDAAFEYVSSTPDQVLALSRQLENLRSRLCATAVFVCTSAIDLYTRRMQVLLMDSSTINTSALYNRHTETLNVVGKVCEVFRSSSKDRGDYSSSVSEIEKSYFQSRSKVLVPVIDAFMVQSIGSMKLSMAVRKTVYFVNSIIDQDLTLFKNFLSKSSLPTMQNLLLRDLSSSLYNPLRTSVINCMDLYELRESAEIIRLEIVPDKSRDIHPSIISLVFKLHRDIQERLIYRIESFMRDEIRSSFSSAELLLEKTKECLSIITGVLDPQTFQEISSEALSASVDVLMGHHRQSHSKDELGILKLISQLLELRERITMIDCEYSLMAVSSPLFDTSSSRPGMTDTIRRLVNRSNTSTPNSGAVTPAGTSVRVRIESDLRILCDEFSALVIATLMTRSGDGKLVEYLNKIHREISQVFSNDPAIALVLTRPILTELESTSSVPRETVEMAHSIFNHHHVQSSKIGDI